MKSGMRDNDKRPDAQAPTAPSGISRAVGRLVAAVIVALIVALLALIPPLHFEGWRWLALALTSALSLGGALGLHRSAFAHVRNGASHPDILTSAAIAASYLWAAATIESADPGIRCTVAAVIAVLGIAVHQVRDPEHTTAEVRVPRWLVPAVLALALSALVGWLLVDDVWVACSVAVAILIVGCSTALVLATPAAVLTGIRRGATLGIGFSGMAALDAARRIDSIVLDKNKTVTTGDLAVVSVDALDPDHDRNMRWFAGALEHSSDHPVGLAIAKLAGHGRVTDVQQLPGLGVMGAVDRHPVRVGSPDWIGLDAQQEVGTTVAVEVDGRPLGRITVADAVRPHAREAIDELRRLGLDPILVSDRNRADTDHLAGQVGIDTRFPCSTAEHRSGLVVELQLGGHTVAMVGNRELNARALDAANLAITTPDDHAAEAEQNRLTVAEIDISIVAGAIRLARATLDRADANRKFALLALAVPAPFAAAGLINPAFAAIIAVAGTAVVGGNSLRLRPPTLHPRMDPVQAD